MPIAVDCAVELRSHSARHASGDAPGQGGGPSFARAFRLSHLCRFQNSRISVHSVHHSVHVCEEALGKLTYLDRRHFDEAQGQARPRLSYRQRRWKEKEESQRKALHGEVFFWFWRLFGSARYPSKHFRPLHFRASQVLLEEACVAGVQKTDLSDKLALSGTHTSVHFSTLQYTPVLGVRENCRRLSEAA